MQSCKVGPNYQKIEYPSESVYRFDSTAIETDTVLNLQWWSIFNDPILDTLVRIALEENKDILLAATFLA